ncbi:hypothetical protein HYZ41_00450 [archaeon]|nr:hypothetical protein [archaeon]
MTKLSREEIKEEEKKYKNANLELNVVFAQYPGYIDKYMNALNNDENVKETEMYKMIKEGFSAKILKKLETTPKYAQLKALRDAKKPPADETEDEFVGPFD